MERDFARALPELEIARRLLPNDTEAESTWLTFTADRVDGVKPVPALSGLFPAIRSIKL